MKEELYGVCAYVNPDECKEYLQAYRRFREISRSQSLKLCTIQLIFDDRKADLKQGRFKDADMLITIKANKKKSYFNQIDRLINIAVKKLPKHVKKICWLNPMTVFIDDEWVSKLRDALDDYDIVQPFSVSSRVRSNECIFDINPQTLRYSVCLLNNALEYDGIHFKKSLKKIVRKYPSLLVTNIGALVVSGLIRRDSTRCNINPDLIEFGGAWGMNRRVFERMGGLYDRCIIGRSERLFAEAIQIRVNCNNELNSVSKYSKNHLKDMIEWLNTAKCVLCNSGVGCIDGVIVMHQLREIESQLHERTDIGGILSDFDFDPTKQLKITKKDIYAFRRSKHRPAKKILKKIRKRVYINL